jgi:hypothetical protein
MNFVDVFKMAPASYNDLSYQIISKLATIFLIKKNPQ